MTTTWFNRVKNCIGWGGADQAGMAELRRGLDSNLDAVVDTLSGRLAHLKDAQQLMSNPRFVGRLREVLREWLAGLLEGAFDEEYAKARWSLVRRLMDIDLDFADLILLESLAREALLDAVRGSLEESPQALWDAARALGRALSVDLALIHESYLQVHDDERERAMLDRFLAITGFSRTLYENLAEAREWSDVSLQQNKVS